MSLLNESGMSREVHASFYEGLAGKFYRSTLQLKTAQSCQKAPPYQHTKPTSSKKLTRVPGLQLSEIMSIILLYLFLHTSSYFFSNLKGT